MKHREIQALVGLLLAAASAGLALGDVAWGLCVFGVGLVVTTIPGWFR